MDIYEEIYTKNKKIIDIAIKKLGLCEKDPLHFVGHTIDVVNYVKELLEKIPANEEICIIAAYWYDVGRTMVDKGHEEESGRILKEEMIKLKYNDEMIEQCYLAVVNHKRNCIPQTIEGKIVRDADKIAYIGRNRWKRCIEENPHALDEIVEVYLPILRDEILRLEYSKEIFDRDMNSYIKEYLKTMDFYHTKDNICMNRIIVEVGSTCTKVDKFDGNNIEKLEGKTIQFKKHYNEDKKLRESDIKELIESINNLKNISEDIYVCGTSIFRMLDETERVKFLDRFKKETGYNFEIISQERENELTVFGATRCVDKKACVFIGGGGSTEIALYDNRIKESVNTKIGVIDVMQQFPDLAEDIAITDIEEVKKFIKERLNLPKEKADILILSGGGHEKFARYSGIRYEENSLYEDKASPIMMNIKSREEDTKRYYKEISLDEIRKRVKDPDWWYATRAMCAFVLVVAEEIGAKYIVPTDIAMVYGILDE